MDQIDSRINGKTASTAQPMFTSGTTANPSFWAGDVDWSCIGLGEPARGCLISRRHILTANHYFPAAPTTETFRQADGTIITRTVTSFTNGGDDCYVGILDSDVPPGVKFATVLPENYADKVPDGIANLPAVQINQSQKAGVAEVGSISHIGGGPGTYIWMQFPSVVDRRPWTLSIINGDSGRPGFAILHGHPVLLCTWNYGGYGGGPFTTLHLDSINAAMHTLSVNASASTDYQLTTEDLSGYSP